MPSSSRSIPLTALVTLLLLLAFAGSAHAPTVSAASCDRQSSSVRVSLDQSEYPYTTDHTEDAIRADHPSLLHIDRDGADENPKSPSTASRPSPATIATSTRRPCPKRAARERRSAMSHPGTTAGRAR